MPTHGRIQCNGAVPEPEEEERDNHQFWPLIWGIDIATPRGKRPWAGMAERPRAWGSVAWRAGRGERVKAIRVFKSFSFGA